MSGYKSINKFLTNMNYNNILVISVTITPNFKL